MTFSLSWLTYDYHIVAKPRSSAKAAHGNSWGGLKNI
jgi:hypothetical protein